MRIPGISLRLLNFIFFFIAALLLFLSGETFIRIRNIANTSKNVTQLSERRNLILQSFDTFKDIESSTRGFILLNDPLFFENRENALKRLPVIMEELKLFMSQNPIQNYFYDQLDAIYKKRLKELDSIINTTDQAKKRQVLARSAETISISRIQITKILEEEDDQLNAINEQLKKQLNIAPFTVLTFVVFLIVALMLGYFSLLSQFRISRKLQANLEESNTSLEMANKQMAHTQTFLKSILDTNPNGTLVYEALRDKEGMIEDFHVTFASGSIKVLGDKDPNSIIGKKITELYPALKNTGFYKNLISVTETGKSETLTLFYPFDGKLSGWFEVYMSKLNDGLILIGRDITFLKEAEEELMKQNALLNTANEELISANNQLKRFTFVASHDLQEPLRKIQLFSNKLLDKIDEHPELKEETDKIRESAARMSELLTAITRYSRLQSGELNVQLVDLNHISQQVISELESQIREKHASIEINKLPTINCDPLQISQLFHHLISNSIKFSDKPPVIKVDCVTVDDPLVLDSLQPEYSYYRLRFTDNGIGFDNEYSDKMFVIFQRLHSTNTYPGTGVGLALCQKIVENHNGKISAYSKENEGSTFDVYLPANLTLN